MYYAEKIIDEVLHYRRTPKGTWRPVSAKSMTKMLEQLRAQVRGFDEIPVT